MNLFEFVTMPRIIFGNGSIQQVGSLAAEYGARVLIVSGKSQDRLMKLLEILQHQELEVFVFPVTGEPTVEDIRAGVLFAREKLCDVVLGFGGGSALDASKAIAVLYSNEGDIYDYLGIGVGVIMQERAFVYDSTHEGTEFDDIYAVHLREASRQEAYKCGIRFLREY